MYSWSASDAVRGWTNLASDRSLMRSRRTPCALLNCPRRMKAAARASRDSRAARISAGKSTFDFRLCALLRRASMNSPGPGIQVGPVSICVFSLAQLLAGSGRLPSPARDATRLLADVRTKGGCRSFMTKPPVGACKAVPSDSVFAAHRFRFGEQTKRERLSSSACNRAAAGRQLAHLRSPTGTSMGEVRRKYGVSQDGSDWPDLRNEPNSLN